MLVVKAFYSAIIPDMKSNFIAIDFETANNDRSSACAIGLVRVEDGKIVAKESRLINPHTYFHSFCVAVHGLTERDVENAPPFDEVWQELTPMLKDAEFIVAHNASFDKSVLYKSCEKYKIAAPKHKITCSIKAAKSFVKLPSYKLNKVCAHLGIQLDHHEALSDAMGCAQIMIKALEKGYKV